MALKKSCGGCGKIIGYTEVCPCRAETKKLNNRYYDKYHRDKVTSKIYESKAWREIRSYVRLRDNNVCQCCAAEKTLTRVELVHHIKPLNKGGQPYDVNNCISLCNQCHAQVHAEYNKSEHNRIREQERLYKIMDSVKSSI